MVRTCVAEIEVCQTGPGSLSARAKRKPGHGARSLIARNSSNVIVQTGVFDDPLREWAADPLLPRPIDDDGLSASVHRFVNTSKTREQTMHIYVCLLTEITH